MILTILGLSACSSGPSGSGSYTQCVPYARELSGIQIRGNAHEWWNKAPQSGYLRGQRPWPGAVLVLSQTAKLRHGHVAVVRQVVEPRTIVVTHANWGKDAFGRGLIYDAMTVIDVSARNDWTNVRFQTAGSRNFGAVYPAKGFIYQKT
ncbi:MAG: CHAP domain-containing protein [Alphaproteobacteria bacterium]